MMVNHPDTYNTEGLSLETDTHIKTDRLTKEAQTHTDTHKDTRLCSVACARHLSPFLTSNVQI